MLRILTLREGTRRSRHPDTDAREAEVLSVALAALRRPERSAVRDGRPKPTESAPRFVLVFLVFRGRRIQAGSTRSAA